MLLHSLRVLIHGHIFQIFAFLNTWFSISFYKYENYLCTLASHTFAIDHLQTSVDIRINLHPLWSIWSPIK